MQTSVGTTGLLPAIERARDVLEAPESGEVVSALRELLAALDAVGVQQRKGKRLEAQVREWTLRAQLSEAQARETALMEAMRVAIDRLDHPDLRAYDPKNPARQHFATVTQCAAVLEAALGREPRTSIT